MDSTVIPARRRRHSGSLNPTDKTNRSLDPPPRPKSTPGERPAQRRRQESPTHSSESESEAGPEHNVKHTTAPGSMQIDDENDQGTKKEPAIPIQQPSPRSVISFSDRPTRPLPSSKSRKTNGMANPHATLHIPANPSMLPFQAHVPRGGAASTQRRLYVVLEQACLEAYRVSSGGRGSKNGKEGEVKYTLLNCDDHQGILAKMGRDIADARPDITHQVCFFVLRGRLGFGDSVLVPPDVIGFTVEQGRVVASLYSYGKGRVD